MNRSRRRMALGLAAALGLALVGCGSSLDTATSGNTGGTGGNSPTTGTITGLVTGSYSSPVKDATVSVGGVATVTPVTTDATGHYTLVNVPPGFQSVVVTKSGYDFHQITAFVTAGQTVTENIVGTTNPDPPRFTRVTITDSNGNDATAKPNLINGLLGTTVTISALATSPFGLPVTVTANYDGGTIPLVKQNDGSYVGAQGLAPNNTAATKTYTFTVTASDTVNQALWQSTVDVVGLNVPGGVGGSVGGSGGGQPPIPSIRRR